MASCHWSDSSELHASSPLIPLRMRPPSCCGAPPTRTLGPVVSGRGGAHEHAVLDRDDALHRLARPMVHSSKHPCSVWDMSAAETIRSSLPEASSCSVASVLFEPRFEQCFLVHTSILRCVCMETAAERAAAASERAGAAPCMRAPAQQPTRSTRAVMTRMVTRVPAEIGSRCRSRPLRSSENPGLRFLLGLP